MTPPVPAPPAAPPDVWILLALYNGAAHLPAQLQSYLAQSHGSWGLIVSDDGSQDAGPALVRAFQARAAGHEVRCQPGPGRGFVRNFFALLQAVPAGAAYAALSDQDDVWHGDKLARALAALSAVPAQVPALYCARTMICAEDLTPLGPSPRFGRAPDFRNALVQSIGGGNTMVLNRAALDLVQAAIPEAQDAVAHDWWLYQILTACGGQILRDETAVLDYRQHGGNLIGANLSWRARIARVALVLGRRFQRWNQSNIDTLSRSSARFTPAARQTLQHYSAARQGRLGTRLAHLRAAGVYRQSRLGTLALYFACVLHRL